MAPKNRHRLSAIALAILAVVLVPPAYGVGWFDDFNDGNATDGNPVTWTPNGSGFLPGIYDASSGDYMLSAPGNANDNDSLDASVNVNFTDTYVRTQAVVMPGMLPEETAGTLGVWARFDPPGLSGYLALLSTGSHLELLRIDGGSPITLNEMRGLDIDTLTDAMIELNAVGDLLSVYLWRPGDPKPATPVLTANDATYTSGRAGILHNENDDGTIGVFRFAAAQDTPFVDALAGDYNMNGAVDAADYVAWRNGDSPDDTSAGYDLWKANFGTTLGAGGQLAAAVPEPTSITLLSLFMAMAWCMPRSRGRLARRACGACES